MDCKETMEILDQCEDRPSQKVDWTSVQSHVRNCRSCSTEQGFRNCLKQAFRDLPVVALGEDMVTQLLSETEYMGSGALIYHQHPWLWRVVAATSGVLMYLSLTPLPVHSIWYAT